MSRLRSSNPNMDQLVHDFNTALDETAGSNSSSRSSASRRKVIRRIFTSCVTKFYLLVLEAALQEHQQSQHRSLCE